MTNEIPHLSKEEQWVDYNLAGPLSQSSLKCSQFKVERLYHKTRDNLQPTPLYKKLNVHLVEKIKQLKDNFLSNDRQLISSDPNTYFRLMKRESLIEELNSLMPQKVIQDYGKFLALLKNIKDISEHFGNKFLANLKAAIMRGCYTCKPEDFNYIVEYMIKKIYTDPDIAAAFLFRIYTDSKKQNLFLSQDLVSLIESLLVQFPKEKIAYTALEFRTDQPKKPYAYEVKRMDQLPFYVSSLYLAVGINRPEINKIIFPLFENGRIQNNQILEAFDTACLNDNFDFIKWVLYTQLVNIEGYLSLLESVMKIKFSPEKDSIIRKLIQELAFKNGNMIGNLIARETIKYNSKKTTEDDVTCIKTIQQIIATAVYNRHYIFLELYGNEEMKKKAFNYALTYLDKNFIRWFLNISEKSEVFKAFLEKKFLCFLSAIHDINLIKESQIEILNVLIHYLNQPSIELQNAIIEEFYKKCEQLHVEENSNYRLLEWFITNFIHGFIQSPTDKNGENIQQKGCNIAINTLFSQPFQYFTKCANARINKLSYLFKKNTVQIAVNQKAHELLTIENVFIDSLDKIFYCIKQKIVDVDPRNLRNLEYTFNGLIEFNKIDVELLECFIDCFKIICNQNKDHLQKILNKALTSLIIRKDDNRLILSIFENGAELNKSLIELMLENWGFDHKYQDIKNYLIDYYKETENIVSPWQWGDERFFRAEQGLKTIISSFSSGNISELFKQCERKYAKQLVIKAVRESEARRRGAAMEFNP